MSCSLNIIVNFDWEEVNKNIAVASNTIYFRLPLYPEAVMYYRKGNWFVLLCEEFITKYNWNGPFPYTPPTGIQIILALLFIGCSTRSV